MSREPSIVILFGGQGAEREISLASGYAVAAAMPEAQAMPLGQNALPDGLDPAQHVIFPVFHGAWGEGGELQQLLEMQGFAYAGSDAASSALCMDKPKTKDKVRVHGVRTVPGTHQRGERMPTRDEIVGRCGHDIVVKPANEGSSVGLHIVDASGLAHLLPRLTEGRWMFEERIPGRELTVGILDGQAMGIVEMMPEGGVYDFQRKYTSGASQYRFPAELDEGVATEIRGAAETAFKACGCRDFARVDFRLSLDGKPYFLEINTIPGLTSTSLLPKSASCLDLDFPTLVKRMLAPACQRFTHRNAARS